MNYKELYEAAVDELKYLSKYFRMNGVKRDESPFTYLLTNTALVQVKNSIESLKDMEREVSA